MVTGVDRIAVCSFCGREMLHICTSFGFWYGTEHGDNTPGDRLASPHPPRPQWVTSGAPW